METIKKYFSEFSDTQLRQLSELKELYGDWNEKINVISRKDMEKFYEHHVLHSFAIAAIFEFEEGMEVMDLGTGGGFPGLPLAILFPQTNFHLVDSINKKLKVASSIAEQIGLKNLSVQHSRAEDIRDRKFDAVVSRAVAPLKDLWRWSRPLLRKYRPTSAEGQIPNGLVCLKGGDLGQEISESGCKPRIWEIESIFPEEHFREKYVLYVPFK